MDMELIGKRALVTGSSSGLGAEIARSLAAEGVAVVVHGRDQQKAWQVAQNINDAGHSAAVVCADLEDEAEVLRLAREAEKAFAGIDILINNAGSRSAGAIGFHVPPSEWLLTYQRNVVAPVQLAEYFAPQMTERGWGRIIQISSLMGLNPIGSVPDYASSKAAMINFSLNLSKSLSNTGVTVNTVSPGLIWTPANEAYFKDLSATMGWPDDVQRTLDIFLKEHARQTVNRIGQPRDIAAGVTYLASPLAGFINGTNLRIDGGHSSSIN